MKHPHAILKRPLITEKANTLNEQLNKVTFRVDGEANRREIKVAVEATFRVHVISVHTCWMTGKIKRLGRRQGKRPDWKKAVVTLKAGEKIDLLEGA